MILKLSQISLSIAVVFPEVLRKYITVSSAKGEDG